MILSGPPPTSWIASTGNIPSISKPFPKNFWKVLSFIPGQAMSESSRILLNGPFTCVPSRLSQTIICRHRRQSIAPTPPSKYSEETRALPMTASPTLDDLVKANLEKILKETQGCVEASAEMMGLSRASLYRKIKKYNIDIKDYRYLSQM
ncbi:MAG: hypothetical protein CVV64_22635 [Candidatus Wallbacteria bacterium HGW-Wallbacteria-1]|uniref:DNA binding HTH domain-containing protein n=1 Tax=Candidatus Wallbacteria bacterium HGW-Wallbacteria-1 TaxID=2013854 RepID=A0A2N1PFN3_9BACT|nr:MAG: hypothetical protein CVV64_22635 [Candidatus Wallbacteria bacterium HGW-Wallbacteria-1]